MCDRSQQCGAASAAVLRCALAHASARCVAAVRACARVYVCVVAYDGARRPKARCTRVCVCARARVCVCDRARGVWRRGVVSVLVCGGSGLVCASTWHRGEDGERTRQCIALTSKSHDSHARESQ